MEKTTATPFQAVSQTELATVIDMLARADELLAEARVALRRILGEPTRAVQIAKAEAEPAAAAPAEPVK